MEVELTQDGRKIRVKLEDRVVFLKAVPWTKLDDLHEYQKILLEEFLKCNASIGTLLKPSNRLVWDTISKTLELTPKDSELTLEELEEVDCIQKLFFTTNTGKDLEDGFITLEDDKFKPSMISIINGMDFYQILRTLLIKEKTT